MRPGIWTTLGLVTFLSVIPSSNASTVQNRPPESDPVISAVSQAVNEGRLLDAEKILRGAIRDTEQRDPESPRLALLLRHLAGLYERKGRNAEATAVAERALEIDRKAFGPDSPEVAGDLNNLSFSYRAEGKTAKAEGVLKQALDLARKNPGPKARTLLMVLNNFSEFYAAEQHQAEAVALLEEAVRVCESEPEPHESPCAYLRRSLVVAYRGAGNPEDAERFATDAVQPDAVPSRGWDDEVFDLETLADHYEANHVHDLAEATYQKAIATIEKKLGADDPTYLPAELERLGELFAREGRNSEAEELFKRALDLRERAAGPKHPELAAYLNFSYLINLYRAGGRLGEMEPILRQALEVQERILGPWDAAVAGTLLELAYIYEEEEKYFDADPLYQRALEIRQLRAGADDPQIVSTLERHAALLRKMNEPTRAQAIAARAEKLRAKLAEQNKK